MALSSDEDLIGASKTLGDIDLQILERRTAHPAHLGSAITKKHLSLAGPTPYRDGHDGEHRATRPARRMGHAFETNHRPAGT